MLDPFKTNGNSPPAMRIDFEFSGCGSLYLLLSPTSDAYAWIEGHLPADAVWLGRAIVVEHPHIGPIIGAVARDDLRVH